MKINWIILILLKRFSDVYNCTINSLRHQLPQVLAESSKKNEALTKPFLTKPKSNGTIPTGVSQRFLSYITDLVYFATMCRENLVNIPATCRATSKNFGISILRRQ